MFISATKFRHTYSHCRFAFDIYIKRHWRQNILNSNELARFTSLHSDQVFTVECHSMIIEGMLVAGKDRTVVRPKDLITAVVVFPGEFSGVAMEDAIGPAWYSFTVILLGINS